ncbi:MAG TPA: hypothetical protein VGM11_12890 [Acidobacteriaceae bacterium]
MRVQLQVSIARMAFGVTMKARAQRIKKRSDAATTRRRKPSREP